MTYWTYRRPFTHGPHACEVRVPASFSDTRFELWVDGECVDRQRVVFDAPLDPNNIELRHRWPDGQQLTVEAGAIGSWRWGIVASVDGVRIHESHPGQRIAWPQWVLNTQNKLCSEAAKRQAAERAAQWQRNKWSIGADVLLGLLFFVVAKFTDLTTAALVGAAAGLGLVLLQRFVKVDLLGGLALFGVFMLLVSAGFSLAFQDDWAVKMKGTLLGLFTAALFLGDGFFNRGRYFGQRLARYLTQPVEVQRLAVGLGVLGAFMAAVNYGVARWASTDLWLNYSTFGDVALWVLLYIGVLRFAAVRPQATSI